MEDLDSDDEQILSGFKKVEDKSQIDGYADGLSDGRDAVYQEGFDAGYEDGFKMGFTLGLYKAMVSTEKNKVHAKELNYASKGECQVCVDSELVKQDVNDLRQTQQKKISEVEKMLTERYGPISYTEVTIEETSTNQ